MREEGGERRGGGALAVLGRLSQFPGRWLRAGCGDAGVGRAAGSQGAARGQPRQPARAPLGPSVLPNRVTGHRMCQVSDCIPGRWVTAACPRARWRGTSRRRREEARPVLRAREAGPLGTATAGGGGSACPSPGPTTQGQRAKPLEASWGGTWPGPAWGGGLVAPGPAFHGTPHSCPSPWGFRPSGQRTLRFLLEEWVPTAFRANISWKWIMVTG